MALSGTIKGKVTSNSGDFTYQFDWSATQDIVSNTSTITVRHYWTRLVTTSFDSVGTRRYGITIDGKPFEGKKRMDYSPWPSDTTISTATHTVTHNADGTKKIVISTYANGTASSYGPSNGTGESGDCTASAEITLDPIPRAAQLLNATNFNASAENPTIEYSNPAGDAADVQVAIYNAEGTESYAGYRSISRTGTSYTFPLTDAERSKIINSVPNGTNTMYLRFYLKSYINNNLVEEPRYLTRIVTVNRAATIISAPNFTDEDNPTISYTNPGGNTVDDIQVGIFDPTGTITYVEERSVPKTDGSYTFNLTDDDRQRLISAIPTGTNKTDVGFYITTKINNSIYERRSVIKTLTITNALPEISCDVRDIGSYSTSLTNNEYTMIKGFNYMYALMEVSLKKGATIVSRSITNGDNVILDESGGFFNNADNDTFIFSVTDSFGQTVTNMIIVNMVDYSGLTCNVSTKNPTVDGDLTLNINGNFFDESFGVGGRINQLTLQWRIKENNGSYGEWIIAYPEILNNEYSISILIPKLNYRSSYTIQAMAIDLINTSGVLSLEKTVKVSTVFNWGEDNFDINVPLYVDEIVCNTNIFNSSLELGSYDSKTGEKLDGTDGNIIYQYRSADKIEVNPSTSYTIYINESPKRQVVLFYDEDHNFISETRDVQSDGIFTTPTNAKYITFRCYASDYDQYFLEFTVQIIKVSPIKLKTLNGVSIAGGGDINVGGSKVVLYNNSNGATGSITLNDDIGNYSSVEVTYGELYNGTLNYESVKKIPVINNSVTKTVLDFIAANSNSTAMLFFSKIISISGKTLTIDRALKITTTSSSAHTLDTSTTNIGIIKIEGCTDNPLIYINGDEVKY